VKGQSGMWWNGTLVVAAPKDFFPAATAEAVTGATKIVVNAAGNLAGGVAPHFKVMVDGKVIGEGSAGTAAKDFTFNANIAAGQAHKVQIQYDNDGFVNGQDRNLIVNKITINGNAVNPTDASVTYDKGALDGKDVVKGQSSMWWGGTLVVDAPAKEFPAGGSLPQSGPSTTTITVNASGAAAGGVCGRLGRCTSLPRGSRGGGGDLWMCFNSATGAAAPARYYS
ncbi:carbohydrate-binding domain-containing protein, partial [Stenotrophomonas muris]|uniref:carbohydrate-binding domain-containing protein n=1 Tax=Stenotrophomonas muris TaxID=2963283 RepID=UPI00300F2D98